MPKLPELKAVTAMSPEQLMRTLDRLHMKPDLKEIDAAAKRAFDARLGPSLKAGVFPDEATWEQIDAGIERSVLQTVKAQVRNGIRSYRLERIRGIASRFVWISVLDDGTCASCEKRHGRVRTMAQWEAEGMPGNPGLVCSQGCRCSLHPDVAQEASE